MTYRSESEYAKSGKRKIADGVDNSIEATVFDYTNANPLAVRLTDATGDYVDAAGGGGATNATIVDVNMTTTQTEDLKVSLDGETVTVDGSGVTQPISAAALPLPSGAATAAAQLADGHNVTVDNAAGAAAVNIQDGGNTITVDGTVTANLGATDNAVLDSIDTSTGFINKSYSWQVTTSVASGDVTLVAAGGASNYIYLKKILICNRDDADMDVSIQEISSATDQFPPVTLPAFGGRIEFTFAGNGHKMPSTNSAVQANVTNAGASPSWSAFVEYYTSTT